MRNKPFLKDKSKRTEPKKHKAANPLIPNNRHNGGWFPPPAAPKSGKPSAKPVRTMSAAATAALVTIDTHRVYYDGRYWNDVFMQGCSYIPVETIQELRSFKAVCNRDGMLVRRVRKVKAAPIAPVEPVKGIPSVSDWEAFSPVKIGGVLTFPNMAYRSSNGYVYDQKPAYQAIV